MNYSKETENQENSGISTINWQFFIHEEKILNSAKTPQIIVARFIKSNC